MTVTIAPAGPFQSGKEVEVTATPSSPASGWQWSASNDGQAFTPLAGETKNTLTFKVDDYVGKTLKVTAALIAGATEDGTLAVSAAPEPQGDGGSGAGPPETPAVWYGSFAGWAGGVAVILLLLFMFATNVRSAMFGLDATTYAKLDGRAVVAAAVIGPVILVGVTVTLIGVWMVAVEWRGRFRKAQTSADVGRQGKGGLEDVSTLVTSLGKLRGGTLMLLAGTAILLSVAWMTSSTANATPTPTPTPTPTSSTTTAATR